MRRLSLLALVGACANAPATTDPTPVDAAPSVEPSASPSPSPTPIGAPSADPIVSDWCTEGLTPLDETTCFVLPDAPASPRELLIYLHGVVAPTGDAQRVVQQIVREHATKNGYVALVPRGRRGIGPKGMRDWWAWPTSADAYRANAASMIAEWLDAKKKLEATFGAPFERTYLAGSSNGAYFVAILALSGAFVADGFGAMSGGGRGAKTSASLRATSRPPFYVGYGTQDDAKGDPIGLGDLLREAGWPHEVRAHAVGHGARGVYLDEALALWRGADAGVGATRVVKLRQ